MSDLSPEAVAWMRAPFPVGRLDDTPSEAAQRRGWSIVGSAATAVVAVGDSGKRYTINQTNAGPRAQETRPR